MDIGPIRWLSFSSTITEEFHAVENTLSTYLSNSVTRYGDLLDFGQVFKAFGNNYLPKSPIFLGIFCKGVKIYHFSSEIIFGQLL